jgi:hypothetical protein
MPNLLSKVGGVGGVAAGLEVYDDGSVILKNASAATILAVSSAGKLTYAGDIVSDTLVLPTITVPNATGGATTAALTMQLNRTDGTPITSAREVMICASLTRFLFGMSSTLTYSSATVGTIVSSGNNYALVRTNASGAFACTVTNSADETLYFMVEPAHCVSDTAYSCLVRPGVADPATWSA